MEDRLMKIFDELDGLIKKYRPDVMGVEKLFFNRNVTTAIPVGQARGVVLLAAAKNGLRLVERTPMQIKLDVTQTHLPLPFARRIACITSLGGISYDRFFARQGSISPRR